MTFALLFEFREPLAIYFDMFYCNITESMESVFRICKQEQNLNWFYHLKSALLLFEKYELFYAIWHCLRIFRVSFF